MHGHSLSLKLMLQKSFTIFLMFLSYAIMLGHSMVVHHHHDEQHDVALITHHHHGEATQSHSHDHDQNEEEQSDIDLSHLFAHFLHAEEGTASHVAQNFNRTIAVNSFLLIALIPEFYQYIEQPLKGVIVRPPEEHELYFSPELFVSGLRAPPALLG